MLNGYLCFKDNDGFLTQIKYDTENLHLKRKKDYLLEIIKKNNDLKIILNYSQGEFIFNAKILKYELKDKDLLFEYQLHEQNFKYLIRRIYG